MYKTLFLNILFSIDLKKVIFVDTNQIMCVVLKELIDLDLHGMPYKYISMNDNNMKMQRS